MEKEDFETSLDIKIRVENDTLYCGYYKHEVQEIAAEDILIIGLHTNWNGNTFYYKYIDFVTKDNQWQWFPLFAEDANKLVDFLQNRFELNFKDLLLNKFDKWNSTVVYPIHLEGNDFYKFIFHENYKEPKTTFDKILNKIGLGNFNTLKELDLSNAVREDLNKAFR